MKKNKLAVDNGISLQCRHVNEQQIKLPILSGIILTLLSIIATVSAVMTMVTMLQLKIQPTVVIYATVGFCMLFSVIYRFVKKNKWLVIISAIIISLIVFLCFKDALVKGVNILYYQGLESIYDAMDWDITFEHTYSFNNSLLPFTNAVITILAFILSSVTTYFIVVRPSFLAILLLTFPFFEIGAAFGAVPTYFYTYLMVASWTSTLAYSVATNSKTKVKKPNGKSIVSKMKEYSGRFSVSAISIALITVILLSSITAFLNAISFQRAEDVDGLRKDIKYVAADVIDYITGKDNDGSLKEGNLLEMGDRVIKDRHYFYLETSMQKVDEHLKLKGYTATVYKDNKWQQTENYDVYKLLYDKLDGYSLRLGGINGNLLSGHKDYDKFNASSVTLSGFRRKKDYAYELYYADFNTDFTSNMDVSMKPVNSSKYSYNAYIGYEYLFKITESDLYKSSQFQEAIAEYIKFVNKEYTVSVATDSVKKLANDFKADNKYQLVDKIRNYFYDNFTHKFTAKKCPQNKDFVENFLFNTKSGYSAHFATAAAVMLQSQGVPARYVEGYFIPKDDFNKTESEHKYGYITFDVTDRYAHAWIEVFDEDFGWIPVEVAPGYWSEPFEEIVKKYKKQKVEVVNPQEKEEQPVNKSPQNTDQKIEDTDNEEDEQHVETTIINIGIVLVIIAIVLLLIVLLILFWILYIIFSKSILKHRLKSKNTNTVLKSAYRYYLRLAKADGINISNIYSYRLYIEKASIISDRVDAAHLEQFIGIMLKNTYALEKPTLQEVDFTRNFVLSYSKKVYKNLSFFKKIAFKLFKVL